MPVRPAPRVKLTSPSGFPSFAKAVGAMKMGNVEGRLRRVVEVSHLETLTNIRGRKRIWRNAFVFWYFAGFVNLNGVTGCYRVHHLRQRRNTPMQLLMLFVESISSLRTATTVLGYLEVVDVENLMNWRDFL